MTRNTPQNIPPNPPPFSPLFLIVGGLIAVLMVVTLVTNRPATTPPAGTISASQGAASDGAAAAGDDSQVSCDAFAGTPDAPGEMLTTASGLQYQVLRAGTGGTHPVASSTVTVHYAGRLTDGTSFDSSYQRGEPSTFPLSGVIAGWTEGVQLMDRCSKYRFTIPGNLAYGAQGRPPTIPPNATLVFDIELIAIR